MYHTLLFLSDQAAWPDASLEAVHLLQLLPTCPWIPRDLTQALTAPHSKAGQRLNALLFGPADSNTCQPSLSSPVRLLYTLQALQALLFPAGRVQASGEGDLQAHHQHVQTVCGCLQLMEEVAERAGRQLELGEQHAQGYLVELYAVVVHLVSNILEEEAAVVARGLDPTGLLSPGTSMGLAVGALKLSTPPTHSSPCADVGNTTGQRQEGGAGAAPGPDMECEEASPSTDGRPAPPPLVVPHPSLASLDLNLATLASMASVLVHVARDAAHSADRGAGLAGLGVGSGGSNVGDVQAQALVQDAVGVVQDSLAALGRLLRRHPSLYSNILSDERASKLVSDVLLHPRLPALRAAAESELSLLCLPPAPQEAFLWLLTHLAHARALLGARTSACAEFYQLFHKVRGLQGAPCCMHLPDSSHPPSAHRIAAPMHTCNWDTAWRAQVLEHRLDAAKQLE